MRPRGDVVSLLPRTHTTRKREERKEGRNGRREKSIFFSFFLGVAPIIYKIVKKCATILVGDF